MQRALGSTWTHTPIYVSKTTVSYYFAKNINSPNLHNLIPLIIITVYFVVILHIKSNTTPAQDTNQQVVVLLPSTNFVCDMWSSLDVCLRKLAFHDIFKLRKIATSKLVIKLSLIWDEVLQSKNRCLILSVSPTSPSPVSLHLPRSFQVRVNHSTTHKPNITQPQCN